MRIDWREGDVIRRLRMEADWTLEELAETSGADLQTIHRLEKGYTKEAKRRTLHRIAQAFGLTERQLRDAIPPPMELPVQFAPVVKRGSADPDVANVVRAASAEKPAPPLRHQTRKRASRL